MYTYLIQPFEHYVIYRNPITDFQTTVIEQLTKELDYKKTCKYLIGTSPAEMLEIGYKEGILKPGKWVEIKTQDPVYDLSTIWPDAIEKMGKGQIYNIDKDLMP